MVVHAGKAEIKYLKKMLLALRWRPKFMDGTYHLAVSDGSNSGTDFC